MLRSGQPLGGPKPPSSSPRTSQNLKDGPPKNEHGIQVFADVLYPDPADLPAFLMWWGDYYASGGLESSETSWDATSDGDPDRTASDVAGDVALPPAIRELILDLQRRRVGADVTNGVAADRGQ